MKRKSFYIAFSGISTALSVVLLSLGSVIWIFSYLMPIISGLFMIIVNDLFGRKSALLTYICVSVLSLVLLTDRESALMYVAFFGYYPLVKGSYEKIKLKFVQILLKLLTFNFAIISVELICVYVFLIPFDSFLGKWGAIILLALGNLLFVVYEKLIVALTILYQTRLKNRITKYLQ